MATQTFIPMTITHHGTSITIVIVSKAKQLKSISYHLILKLTQLD